MNQPLTFRELLEQLAAPTPTPGGGSAAAAAGALSAALVEMVTVISSRRTSGARRRFFETSAREARAIRHRCEAGVARDAQAYERVRQALRALRSNPTDSRLQRRTYFAKLGAAEVPLRLAEDLLELLRRSRPLGERLHPPVQPDLRVAVALAKAATMGAAENVLANLRGLPPSRRAAAFARRFARLRRAVGAFGVRLPAQ